MTSLSTIGPEQQHTEGRTVRDIVEYSPDQVNEVWCRKIFRQVLQSLELQYAMRMPHRPITPDTIVFHENGEPLLLPASDASAEGSEAGDLNALARVLHYAITRELMPSAPLQGRAPGYSDSLVTAVDRCMAPDPAARPQSVEALRALLGIVPLGPPVAARAEQAVREIAARDAPATSAFAPAPGPSPAPAPAAAPTPAAAFLDGAARPHVPAPEAQAAPPVFAAGPEAAPARLSHPSATTPAADALPAFLQAGAAPRRRLVLNRWQRWAVAAGGGALLLALALAGFAELREDASYDRIVLSLPQVDDRRAAPGAAAPVDEMPQSAPQAPAPAAAGGTPAAATGTPPAGAAAAHPGHLADTPAADGIAYKLQIQPWGVVYVDGVDRGVSPPVKRLVLAPGRYTVRVTNPNFHDRVLEVDTANGGGDIAVDFNDEAH